MAEYRKEKYYWFKLKDDFFKRHDIKIIKSMPNGKDYVIFYLQLLCESLAHNGKLRFNEEIPYSEEMLSVITDTNIDVVRSAMKLFVQLKIIEIMDDQTIYMKKLQNMVGSTTIGADKKKLQRSKSIELLEGGQKGDICPPEIEIDIEKDKELEKESETERDYLLNKSSINEIFDRWMRELVKVVAAVTFETFFTKIKLVGETENKIIISGLSAYSSSAIESKYGSAMKNAISKASGGKYTDYEWRIE